ncbi:hypothetical protein E3J95_04500 [Candidatus Aerophobetes bacterium]|uniref:EfeO-type cupredoxin-like domain-containing protein n=1 Tax=Aerophobetes bacterium TaxID=2030807 RepID=A0A523QII2_UNCAE|nr:MAG: hypothetical protein E3J95_04500 [Candidatus Aerophobetes bacterium]
MAACSLSVLVAGSIAIASQADAGDPAVEIKGFSFGPDKITVEVGGTVTWINEDPARHTVTSRDKVFSSGALGRGDSYSFTFTEPGTYDYYCEFHPSMRGTVVVTLARVGRPTILLPLEIHVKAGDDVRWILPGKRKLDPAVFGTPEQPIGFEQSIGVPLEAREKNETGTVYTTTLILTPFSDNFARVTGSLSLMARDVSAVDGFDTEDEIGFTATFTNPEGVEYKVVVKTAIPRGPDHPFFGGGATNHLMHGMTGIGTRLMPTQFVYLAFWELGDLFVNGKKVDTQRIVHVMLGEKVRDENYKLVFDKDVNHEATHLHLILPPVKGSPEGPIQSPVPTGFILPNGKQQPFLHIMFETIEKVETKPLR